MRLPLRAAGAFGKSAAMSSLRSAATRFSRQIATGCSSSLPRRQAGSHGLSQVRPRIPGKTFDFQLMRYAPSWSPSAMRRMYSGTGVCAGQAHWQSTTLWKYSGFRISVGFTNTFLVVTSGARAVRCRSEISLFFSLLYLYEALVVVGG